MNWVKSLCKWWKGVWKSLNKWRRRWVCIGVEFTSWKVSLVDVIDRLQTSGAIGLDFPVDLTVQVQRRALISPHIHRHHQWTWMSLHDFSDSFYRVKINQHWSPPGHYFTAINHGYRNVHPWKVRQIHLLGQQASVDGSVVVQVLNSRVFQTTESFQRDFADGGVNGRIRFRRHVRIELRILWRDWLFSFRQWARFKT